MAYINGQGMYMFQDLPFSMENHFLPAGALQKPSAMVKGQWALEEDRLLVSLVSRMGNKKWSDIAKKVPGRAGKQCRERWNNHLRPDIKKEPWTENEEIVLVQAHSIMGNKWAEIAKMIPGRPENSIKNHWNATSRKMSSKRRWRRAVKNKGEEAKSFLQEYIIRLNEAKEKEAMEKEAKKQLKGKNIEESTPSTLSEMEDHYQQEKENHKPDACPSSENGYVAGGIQMDMDLSLPSSSIPSFTFGSGHEDQFGGFSNELFNLTNHLDALQQIAASLSIADWKTV